MAGWMDTILPRDPLSDVVRPSISDYLSSPVYLTSLRARARDSYTDQPDLKYNKSKKYAQINFVYMDLDLTTYLLNLPTK